MQAPVLPRSHAAAIDLSPGNPNKSGNPIKFALGFVSIVYDVLFMVQHYVLYAGRTAPASGLAPESQVAQPLLSNDHDSEFAMPLDSRPHTHGVAPV